MPVSDYPQLSRWRKAKRELAGGTALSVPK